MKNIPIILLLLLIQIQLTGQNDYTGMYKHYNGETITIKNDSTFEFSNRTWNNNIWAIGKYETNCDTIFLTFISIYDTLKIFDNKNRLIRKELILSKSPESNLIIRKVSLSHHDYANMIEYCIALEEKINSFKLRICDQDNSNYPRKLFYSKKGLFEVDTKGNLIKRKKSSGTNKKFKSIYIKSK